MRPGLDESIEPATDEYLHHLDKALARAIRRANKALEDSDAAPIFPVCAADADVTALLGESPTRLYPFGEAPQDVALPYAVWQVIPGGRPENNLSQAPDMDAFSLQVDVYAATVAAVSAVAEALRDAIEPYAHITRWGSQIQTRHKTSPVSFDVDWFVSADSSFTRHPSPQSCGFFMPVHQRIALCLYSLRAPRSFY
ncbi:hypothetical protein A8U91_04742 [Halomonas elongata]|uniref:Uncharacterized protein n=1 Tax=Halomonas elongata TaxID=2746 RepID=A0A1B8P0B5_HALEL|nr:hypothetical protein A8U91_04742 [Halomonas elongata]